MSGDQPDRSGSGKRRIAVLMHESYGRPQGHYLVEVFAKFWRADGHEVIFLSGHRNFVPADIAVVHVDLSVVPEAYLALARRYPVALNAGVRDIRKSTFSQNLLAPNDDWDGPVIVKTDLNFGGEPERRARGRAPQVVRWLASSLRKRLSARLPTPIGWRPGHYPVFAHLSEVPRRHFDNPELVVAKFQPEVEDGLYCVRLYNFLGHSGTAARLKSPDPMVYGTTSRVVETIEPHPDVVAAREAMGFDYGKFDYVEHDGRAILLDVNKTIGRSRALADNPELMATRRARARAIYAYFPET